MEAQGEIIARLERIEMLLGAESAYLDQVLTAAAATRFTGLSRRTIDNYRTAGKLTLCEIDGVRGFRIRDLLRVKKL